MKPQSLHKWDLKPEIEGLLYFAQRLDEMLFDYSLDSYRPPTLTPFSLCEEALSLIDDIEAEFIELSSLNPILEELKRSIQRDPISKRLLDISVEKYILDNDQSPLSLKKTRLEVLARTLETRRYLPEVSEYIEQAVINNNKRDISHGTAMLVSTLINLGVSKAFLYQKNKEYFFVGSSPSINSSDAIKEYFEVIQPRIHNFDVYFLVSKNIDVVSESVERFRIEVYDDIPDELNEVCKKHSFHPNGDEVLIRIDGIEEFDCFSAREAAERRIDNLNDLFTLFFHRNDLSWREDTLISQCCIESPVIVTRQKSPMQKAYDPSKKHAAKRLNFLLRNLALRFGDDTSYQKFYRVVDLHGISVANDIPENQLLNLWICIETLVPSKSGRNKISNILTSLDPFIKHTYIGRLVERTLTDLTIWNKFETRKLLRRVPGTHGKRLSVKLLHLLALNSQEFQDLRSELYSKLDKFPLLRSRIFSLSEQISSPKKIRNIIDDHAERVHWQIRRLYRTRNLIVHSGRTPPYLGALIENGHDYLDLVLEAVVNLSCGTYQAESLEQAFELQVILEMKMNTLLKGEGVTPSILESMYLQSWIGN